VGDEDLARGLKRAAARLGRFAAAYPTGVRVAGAVALFVGALALADVRGRSLPTPTEVITAALVSASFVVVPALRWPLWLVPATATAGMLVLMPAGLSDSPARPALVLAMFLFSLRSELTAVIVAIAAVGGVVTLAGSLLSAVQGRLELADIAVLPWVLAAAATGQAVRANRAQRAMLEERARRAELGREDEARRRVQAERLRIARELHDAVGHHVALINVQAGALTYLLDKDVARARESVGHIQNASEAALEELRLTVGLLRQPGEEHEPVEPAGRLGRLDELIASFTSTGLRVTCEVNGPARPLPEAVDLTAFRLIQESLTNTAKHAAATSAAIRLTFRPGTLALAVDDDGPPPSVGQATPAGHGIIGMRERAAALGGQLTAGPRPEGGFRVSAELPAPAGAL
jgi:signal transduction histidine kinase